MKTLTIRQVNELHSAFRGLIPRVARRSNVDQHAIHEQGNSAVDIVSNQWLTS
jgi:hypothetical protein